MPIERNELQQVAYTTLILVKEFQHAQNERSDLDRVAFEILLLVKRTGRIRITAIANELEFNPSSITRRVQALKQSGHILTVTDENDLRSSLIELTAAGEEALQHFFDRSVEGVGRILKGWEEDDVRTLAAFLSRYTDSMKDWRLSGEKKTKGEHSDE
ncbi:MarR family transcriptional regulator [Gorillibacterium sp. CAU 1737]|uniref:MarR family winged helix-turn-helix transcriptional regulator n=1 Tax=Gorillibacterium sp. CAU 1737 TaxID=3140362 RepID=UPI003260469F